jgi:uncharacterized membrane protein YhhN
MQARFFLILFGLDAIIELILPYLFPSIPEIRFLTKPLLMILLMCYVKSSGAVYFRNSILFSLFFACLGDIFLMIPGNSSLFFQLGLISFLIMQVSYIYLFIRQSRKMSLISWPNRWLVLIFTIIYVFFFLNFLLPHIVPALKLPVVFYALALGSTFFFAWQRKGSCTEANFYYVVIGAFLFVISDSILAYGKFYHSFFGISTWVMITYILSQLLLTIGLVAFTPVKN